MNKHIEYLKNDTRGECAFLYQSVYLKVQSIYSKLITSLHCLLVNIKTGKNNTYIGAPWFKRAQNSTITIGSNCIFLSKQASNSLGLHHRCMISTNSATSSINIGDNCSFSGITIAGLKSISIKNGVRCGANVTITDSDWHSDDPRSGGSSNVVIEENVWIGANTIILKGVTIGKNSLIGANSVVVKNIPANVIAAGNHCKVVKQMNDQMIQRCDEYAQHYEK